MTNGTHSVESIAMRMLMTIKNAINPVVPQNPQQCGSDNQAGDHKEE
jgi:hypothetical protein